MEKYLIIPNIFHKIYVHPFFYIASFLCAITGYLKDFSIFMILIIIHELGHILSALFYKWNISKITLFPLGAVTFFDEKINRPIKEEFIIAISGIIMQCLFLKILSQLGSIHSFYKAHLFLLFFNILPIYPLDGAKILNLIFNFLLSFIKSYQLTIGISYGCIFSLFLIYKENLIFVLALFLLLHQVFLEMKKGNFLFYKFLLERHLYHFCFKKIKTIKGYQLEKMKRDYIHVFLIKKRIYKEEEVLKSLFDNKR